MAFRTQSSRGSNPAEAVRIFQGEKEKFSARLPFGREVKAVDPMSKIYRHVKYHMNATWKSGIFRLNLPGHFSPPT
jgi:hypothetical protein